MIRLSVVDFFKHCLQLANDSYLDQKPRETLALLIQAVSYLATATPEQVQQMQEYFRSDENWEKLESLANELERRQSYELCEAAFQLLATFDPDDLSYRALGDFYFRRGDLTKAKEHLEHALALLQQQRDEAKTSLLDGLDSSEKEISRLLGLIFLKLGDNDEALVHLSRAVEIEYANGETTFNPSQYDGERLIQNIYLFLFDQYFKEGYLDFCLLLLHKAIFSGEDYSNNFLENAHRRRGECYFKKGNRKEAMFSFRKVLELSPGDKYVQDMLRALSELEGEVER